MYSDTATGHVLGELPACTCASSWVGSETAAKSHQTVDLNSAACTQQTPSRAVESLGLEVMWVPWRLTRAHV